MDQSKTDEQAIGKALGRVPSGVFVLTAKHGPAVGAMLASWVQQASFKPPAVSVAIARGRPIAQLIRDSGRLALSILPDEDRSLMKHYARLKPGEDPFAGISTRPAPSGVPILADALAFLDCVLLSTHEFGGDHELFIARVTAGQMLRQGMAFTHQRGSGLHY
ncbi:flavin reductase family protein [Fontivita pretiosa]|jgi:flavin reductase (DIM6/NTAB) family NADH-FMN oxidoreductase RutF|uniref:flavin reductase family protein n=1 Tax=Fontivita pretiosa TaxID=2989684 RepID=UPI003D18636A